MLPDRVSNPGLLSYESGTLPIELRGPAVYKMREMKQYFSLMRTMGGRGGRGRRG